MKKMIWLIILLMLVMPMVIGAAKNSDYRSLKLQPLFQIRDDARNFIFKSPRDIQAAADGSFFVMDSNQIYWFDSRGKFARSLVRAGQGPGEADYISGFSLASGLLAIHSKTPGKMMLWNRDGKLQKEFPCKTENAIRFVVADNGRFYFISCKFEFDPKKKSGVEDIVWDFLSMDEKGEITKYEATFAVKWFFKVSGLSIGAQFLNQFHATPLLGHRLAVIHTSNYLIKIVDLISGRKVKEITQPYPRVRYFKPETGDKNDAKNKKDGPQAPTPEFFDDIQMILCHNGDIWAVTSTVDVVRGTRIDVFDGVGTFKESLWLPLPGVKSAADLDKKVITLSGDRLYTFETDPDENFFLAAYNLIYPGK